MSEEGGAGFDVRGPAGQFITRASALFLGASVLVFDLASKWWVKNTPALHHYVVIEDFFKIHYVRNRGVAFGLFHSVDSIWKPVILSVLALLALVFVLYYIWNTPAGQLRQALPLGLLLGGILGNSIDRLMHQSVVDFIEVHWQSRFVWPTFNLADAAITCGVFVVLYDTFRGENRPESAPK